MYNLHESSDTGSRVKVTLDGLPVILPPYRSSLASIRSFMETLALERQRLLCAFRVDGRCLDLNQISSPLKPFTKVEGESIDPAAMPVQLVKNATQQTTEIRERIRTAVTLVVINEREQSREHWWKLAQELKRPLLTLSLIPESAYSSPQGSASLVQLRKWQLQQLASIIRDVDDTCWSEDPLVLSDALEQRVLPWLNALHAFLQLWHDTLLSATAPYPVEQP